VFLWQINLAASPPNLRRSIANIQIEILPFGLTGVGIKKIILIPLPRPIFANRATARGIHITHCFYWPEFQPGLLLPALPRSKKGICQTLRQ
jgi:hypothetical protein